MNNYHNKPLLGGNLKFNPYPGIDVTANVANLSPKWMIAIGLSLAALGFYLYYLKKEEENLNKNN